MSCGTVYNRWCSKINTRDGHSKQTVCEGLALAHVVRFIEETMAVTTDCRPVFRMTDLRHTHLTRLHELLCTGDSCNCTYAHNTRLRERILCHFSQMQAHKVGKSYVLLCRGNVDDAVRTACETDYDNDAQCLSKAAIIVRGEMLKHSYLFDGAFKSNCQEDCVPPSLLALVVILNPTSLEANHLHTQAALTNAQLLQFNVAIKATNS